MAKNKEKRSSSAAIDSSKGLASANPPTEKSDQDFISLDAGAIANLTQQIERRLKGGTEAGKKKPLDQSSQQRSNKKEKANFPQKTEGTQKSNKGKKRDRHGDVIQEQVKGGKAIPSEPRNDDTDKLLEQEILALGGNKEDLDLLAGVDSDSEVDESSRGDNVAQDQSLENALRKELAGFLKDAGKFNPVIADEEEDEGEDSEQEDGGIEEETGGVKIKDLEDGGSEMDEPSESPTIEVSAKDQPKKERSGNQDFSSTASAFPKEYSKLTVPPRSDWYATDLPSISVSKTTSGLPRFLLDKIKQHAFSLLEKENQLYSEIQQQSSSSSHKFYSTIMSSGTLSDKISALTLAVQESPIHNIRALENLVSLSKKRSRAQAVDVLRSLKDMFAQGTLLPSDRKLKAFTNQPSLVAAFQGQGTKWTENSPLPGGLEPKHLIVWAFEDFVKEQFFEVLQVLETWCNDEIEFSRTRAISYVYELLKEKPEQEANLLRLLVNKLGDPGKKIASRASYLLLQLGQAHPVMKPTIISGVEEFLFRPGQSMHAKYYAVITLNQTVLRSKEEKVAIQLLEIYFSLFVILLKPNNDPVKQNSKPHSKGGKGKKNENDSQGSKVKAEEHDDQLKEKLVSAVLTGVNRSYPFTSSDTDRLSKHIDTLFRITHSSNFNTSIQSLMLIQQITATHQVAADRFYRTLYESLLDPRVATSSKQSLYLNLLYKSLKNDLNVKRVKAFVKRIVQVLGLHQPSFICGVFFLIRELEKMYPGLSSLVDQAEEDESDEEEVFRDVPDEEDEEQEVETMPATHETQSRKQLDGYDPRKRDPQHSNADKSCLWELFPYLTHFHPSVSVSAAHLLSHEPLTGKPDLTLHTLTHFLDRFIYRNAKASAGLRGSSLMQPLAGSDRHDLLVTAGGMSGKSRTQEPLNSDAFWRRHVEDVAAEDVFFHEYFNRLGKDKKSKKEPKTARKDAVMRDEEAGHEDSDAESEIWQALVESRPELEGDDDSDDDLDLDDLESAFDDEDDVDANEPVDDDDVIFNDESDESDDAAEADSDVVVGDKSRAAASDEDGEDAFDMDVSDEEAFRDSDEDLPSDLDVGGVDGVIPPLAAAEKDDKAGRKKRRKLSHLPTFASVDDYAALLADDDEGLM